MLCHEFSNKVEYVAASLRRRIESGEIQPSQRLGSSVELATEYGVAAMTADRAVRRLVSEGLLVRVQGRGTFVLPARRRFQVGLVAPRLRGGIQVEREYLYDRNTYPLVERECLERGIQLRPFPSVAAAAREKLDGILTTQQPPSVTMPPMPVALFRQYTHCDLPVFQAIPELFPVMSEIFRRLAGFPVRSVHVLINPVPNIRLFGDAFLQHLRLNGLAQPVHTTFQRFEKGLPPQRIGHDFGMAIPDPRGAFIFTTSDFRAAGILEALDQRGVQPGQYQLVGCFNWEDRGFAPFRHPRLTSIDCRRDELLAQAVDLLFHAMANPACDLLQCVKIPARLVVRESAFAPK